MFNKLLVALALSFWSFGQMASADVDIIFDYTYDSGFFASGTAARATLEAAGSFYGTLLQDSLSDITPGGGDSWRAGFYNPANGVFDYYADDLVVGANDLIVYVGTRDLGGSTLGVGGPGGYDVSGTLSWVTNVAARGQGSIDDVQNDGANKTAIDFGPWGGSLSINDQATWNLDHTQTPSGGQNDLYSVVLHELGHLLGIGTADSWDNLIVNDEFTGAQSVAEFGGNVPLESDRAHWLNETQSQVFPDGELQEAAMDPSLLVGTRKLFTDLDVAGLDDLGWEVVPEPASFVLATLCVALLAMVYRRRQLGAA